jgi:hypothetical protein
MLLTAGVVLAGNPGKERIALTAAGKKQAGAEVLQRADVGAGWSGGSKKPDLSSSLPCSDYHPKQSDLVLVGAAESAWQKPAILIDSEAEVLKTAAMVHRDWRRTVLAPQVLPCLRHGFAKSLGPSEKLVSFGRVSFPHVAPRTRAFRGVAKVKTSLGYIPLEIDVVVFGVGRNELSLVVSGPETTKSSLKRIETRRARLLAGRARP